MSAPRFVRSGVLAFVVFAAFIGPVRADEPKGGPPEFKRLKFRPIGPAAGGRVDRACGVPGDPLTYYAAVVRRRRLEIQRRRRPLEADLRRPARLDHRLASPSPPSDPNVIYVGSGEANIRGNVEVGNGIYKSIDAGKTWKHVWKQEGQIGTMIVHPHKSRHRLRRRAGPRLRPQRGARRLPHHRRRQDVAAACCSRTRTPAPPTSASTRATRKVLFAGLWQARRRPWELTSGGPGSGLYVSRDGGDTWTQLVAPPKPDAPDADKEPPTGQEVLRRLAGGHLGQGLRRRRPVRRPARLRPDRGGQGRPVPQRRRRRHLGAGQRRPRPAAAGLVLLDADRPSEERRRGLVPAGAAARRASTAARRSSASRGRTTATITTSGSTRRTPTASSTATTAAWTSAPTAARRGTRRRCRSPSSTTSAADNRTPYYVSGCMQDIGTAEGPSNSLKGDGIRLADWYRRRRRRGRLHRARPDRPEHRLRRRVRRLHLALRPPHAPGQERQHLPLRPLRPRRRGPALPLPVDRPDPDFAARPQGDLPRRQRPVPVARRRPDVEADQRRPDAQRQEPSRSGPAARSPATTPAWRSIAPSSPSPNRRSRRACSGPAATTAWSTSRTTAARPGTT